MHSLQDISKLTGLPVRTIRYYIQKDLVDKPEGARKTASYSQSHLEQLMTVNRIEDCRVWLNPRSEIVTLSVG